jgi:plastocyanin
MVEKGQYGIAFEPQRLTGHPGDTLRFIQRGALPHDVRLRSRPDEAKLPESLGSELLTERGATWEMVLDERFAPGKYFFVCTPHEVMGMAFILYLEPAP